MILSQPLFGHATPLLRIIDWLPGHGGGQWCGDCQGEGAGGGRGDGIRG